MLDVTYSEIVWRQGQKSFTKQSCFHLLIVSKKYSYRGIQYPFKFLLFNMREKQKYVNPAQYSLSPVAWL